MGCLLFTPSHALDRFFLISKLGAALESAQIIAPKPGPQDTPAHRWMPPWANCVPSLSRLTKASGFPEQARQALWRTRGCIFKQFRACVHPCLLLHSSEQDGGICAFYISMAEEAASRWLYLFQSYLFMQKEDCVTSFQVNVFCKLWEWMLKNGPGLYFMSSPTCCVCTAVQDWHAVAY